MILPPFIIYSYTQVEKETPSAAIHYVKTIAKICIFVYD